eukprot:GHVS01059608.1.p2 GENE.GHVS01059608.1~~GHVS01059608.1.p2  ORF type:complete len:103 (+),score=26.85 GHVS01059608.1:243-551(+)
MNAHVHMRVLSDSCVELSLLSSLSCLKIIEQSDSAVKLSFCLPSLDSKATDQFEVEVEGTTVQLTPTCAPLQQLIQQTVSHSTNPCWAVKQALSSAAVRALS